MNIKNILSDKEIIRMKNQNFWGIDYEIWTVQIPLFENQVETLLEEGFMVSMEESDKVTIRKRINPSPEQLRENKHIIEQIMDELSKND